MKRYEFAGGRVRINEGCIYIGRDADTAIYNHLSSDFNLVAITAPRQCGKTSMVYSIGEQLNKQEKIKFALVDFRGFERPAQETRESDNGQWWFGAIFRSIAQQLDINLENLFQWLEKQKEKKLSLTEQWIVFFKELIKENLKDPLLVVFDEIDKLGELGYYTDEFFNGLQVIAAERTTLKVSFILASIAYPPLLLKGVITSAFKTGLHYPLPDFGTDDETIKQWVQGLVIEDETVRFQVGKEILTQTGGQPFLTSFLMHRFNESGGIGIKDVEPLIDEIVGNALNPQLGLQHFKAPREFILERERYAFTVLNEYKRILEKPVDIKHIDEKVFAVLYTTGLTRLVDNRFLDVRSPIYRRVFDKRWCRETEIILGKRDWHSPLIIPSYSKRKKPTICLINTGGTVGMVEHANKMVPPQNEREFFNIYPALRYIADIDFVQFRAKDGVNMFPGDWTKVAEAIYLRRTHGYDGFVIAHGTDTMTYTASAVAFALGPGLNIPVVFVGAQTPHYVPHGDALANLSRACMIASKKIPEVVISFGDEVYRAVRAEKYSDYHFKGFHSPTFPPLAIITEDIEIQNEKLWIDKTGKMECKAEFESRVLQVSQYPGFDPVWLKTVLETGTIKGIIIESLGLGNLPTFSNYNLIPVIEKAINDYHIPVIITSKYPIKPEFLNKYIPASAPLQVGAISAGNMTSSAALTKLMWLLPQIEREIKCGDLKEEYRLEEIRRLITHSYVGEVEPLKIESK